MCVVNKQFEFWSRVWESVVMYVCVVSLDPLWRWQVQVNVYCDQRISAHLRWCIQCSLMLHLIVSGCITCICLWQISHIQTLSGVVVGPGLVSTSLPFMRSSDSGSARTYNNFDITSDPFALTIVSEKIKTG